MNFLIMGAEIGNKGAQSMLYITIHELRTRFPNCTIYYGAWDNYDVSNLMVVRVSTGVNSTNIALGRLDFKQFLVRTFKDGVKFVFGKSTDFAHYRDLKKILPMIDAIIDVSGFLMGRKWKIENQERWLDSIRLAKKYDKPIYFMPQSFGPFNYVNDEKYSTLYEHMKLLMPYSTVIYAREEEGAKALIEEFNLKNVVRSCDLVLQNKKIDLKNIFRIIPYVDIPNLSGGRKVGIVPNKQCFNYGNTDYILDVYKSIIKLLCFNNVEVYIFRHSSDDLEICKKIFEFCDIDEHLHLVERDFSCIEYSEFVKNFDFIVCSRYHGIVNAYRNHVPCILLGWAIKYDELAKLLGQTRYSFDITDKKMQIDDIECAVKYMMEYFDSEKKNIEEKLCSIQNDNCFDIISEGFSR